MRPGWRFIRAFIWRMCSFKIARHDHLLKESARRLYGRQQGYVVGHSNGTMKVLVGVKRVVDYAVKVRVTKGTVDLASVKQSMNPFCEVGKDLSAPIGWLL
jgi:hypothetical protein